MRKYFQFLLIFNLLVFAAQAQRRDTRSLSPFSAVSVGEAINVEITAGDIEEARIEVDGADVDDVITEVFGGRLKIQMDRGNWRNADVRVYLTYKSIDKIEVSSAADLYSTGVVSADQLEIEVSSAGDVELDIDVNELEVRVSSAGDLTLKGKAKEQYVRVSSSGDYDAYELQSENAEVDVSSSGDARVNVSEKLEADASSSGSIYYRGEPSKVYADSSSGGRVRKS